jgi:hypothetical protein
METKTYKPYLILVALMALTSLALAFSVDVRLTDEAGITLRLPDLAGNWRGTELRYCQNPVCHRQFLVTEAKDPNVCPHCGGEALTMSYDEKALLPPDTEIIKKRYVSPDGTVLFVSIVLSGKERASIHRPQVCLVGQGNEITRTVMVPVPLDNRDPLRVMSLEMLQHGRGPDGQLREYDTYYAYWFVGKDRETPYHVQRMIWMSTDRIFRNVAHRWAYISVSGGRTRGSDDYQEVFKAFLHDLYPKMLRKQA